MVAVADQNVTRAFGADVLQAHEVGEHRRVAHRLSRSDEKDLFTLRPDWKPDAERCA